MLRNFTNLGKSLSEFRHINNPFSAIQNSLDKAIDEFYSATRPSFSSEEWESINIFPAVDVIETDKNIKFELEMPGMGPEDIKIDITDNVLIISGEKHTSRQDKDKTYVMREINYGRYERRIPLTDYLNLDSENVEATFKKGMLWINFPKKKGKLSAKKTIEIKQV